MKNLIEVVKANKKAIIKKTLIVAGTAVGLTVAAVVLGKKSEDEDGDEFEEAEDTSSEDVD